MLFCGAVVREEGTANIDEGARGKEGDVQEGKDEDGGEGGRRTLMKGGVLIVVLLAKLEVADVTLDELVSRDPEMAMGSSRGCALSEFGMELSALGLTESVKLESEMFWYLFCFLRFSK